MRRLSPELSGWWSDLARQFRKDLGLVLDEARANGARLEVTALVDQFYAELQAMGGRRWDTSSLAARLQR